METNESASNGVGLKPHSKFPKSTFKRMRALATTLAPLSLVASNTND